MNVADLFISRLRQRSQISLEDEDEIRKLTIRIRDVPAKHYLSREGDEPTQSVLLLEGFLVRSKHVEGRRQILSVHVPGEIPDLQTLYLKTMDHDLTAASASTVGYIEHASLQSLIRDWPSIGEALWRDTLIESAIFREWIANIGCRTAEKRVAHLILELKERLDAIGRDGDEFELPLSQDDLADALGLTPIHINRMLRLLRDAGIMTFRRHTVQIHDLKKLKELGHFDGLYLHEQGER